MPLPWWAAAASWATVMLVLMAAVMHFDRRLTRVERDVAWIRAALVSNGFKGGSDG